MSTKIPNSIDGKTMKAIMKFAKGAANTMLRVPIFYNDKIYVTNSQEGVVLKHNMICDIPKDTPYVPDPKAFDKILVSNEYHVTTVNATGEPELSVYTKNGIEHYYMEPNEGYLSVIKELDKVADGNTETPSVPHPTILGAPAEKVSYVTDYANARGFYIMNSSLCWSGAVAYYLYTFPCENEDTYAFVCACIDKNTL